MRSGGFLGPNALSWSASHCERRAEDYAAIRDIVARCYQLVPERIEVDDPERATVLLTLYVRALEFLQSVIVLVQKGMLAPAHTALRAMVEVVFVFVACHKEDRNVHEFLRQHEHRKLTTIRQARRTESEDLADFRSKANAQPYDEIKLATSDSGQIGTAEWAKRAGLHDCYLTVYAALSGFAHPTVANLLRYRTAPSDFHIGPSERDADILLGTALQYLCEVVERFLSEHDANSTAPISEWRHLAHTLVARSPVEGSG